MTDWAPQHSFQAQLSPLFYQPAHAAPAREPQWLAFNEELAEQLQLPRSYWGTEAGLQLFAGQQLPEWCQPVAQGYAGHQFGQFVPQLGDGRAMLLAELPDPTGKLWDLQLKGSGATAFSRGGDGASALGPVLREYLVSEAMYQLGVPTTRALAAVVTGDWVQRQEGPLPGAILARVASSHLRIGTFQYAAHHGGAEAVLELADYAINRHYPELADSEQPYLDFFAAVAHRQANLVAHWLSIGFIHGVMNTDNMTISGETIDYGPCAFMDHFQRDKCFSSIDRQGRYAYLQQPVIAQWNLARLAECLVPLLHADQEEGIALAMGILEAFPDWHDQAWRERFGQKLGLAEATASDQPLIEDFLRLLEEQQADFTQSFAALADWLTGTPPTPAASPSLTEHPEWPDWLHQWQARLAHQGEPQARVLSRLQQANPLLIPRNHQIARAISEAESTGNLSHFQRLRAAWADPWSCSAENADLLASPTAGEEVTATFCGT